ncbi:MAG TPA: ABC transporter permease [Dehalococcoidia bacterium]|nr:ABC transporter permease [Dehalococcoidia bacterium]
MAEATVAIQLAPWNFWREAVRAAFLLGAREARLAIRTPAYLVPNLVIPVFFYFVMVGSLEEFASRSGISNWEAFQLPVAIVFAVQGGSAGLNMVADIESGYFDKLLLTPANRVSILIGAMGADFLRIMAQAAVVLVIAFATGLEFATGVPGAVALVLLSSFWGLAYSAIGFAVAIKTGNAQATQSLWALFMPMMFLTTLFAPMEALSGWLKVAATVNPMTYLLRGMRALSSEGWDMADLGVAIAAVAALGVVTLTLAFAALKSRVR